MTYTVFVRVKNSIAAGPCSLNVLRAALLEAAEGRLEGQAGGRFVDLDHAGLDAVDEGQGPAQVVGDDAGGEAVPDGVGLEQGVVKVTRPDDAHDGAEDLLLREAAADVDPVEHGRLHEVLAVPGAAAAGEQSGALVPGDLHVLEVGGELVGAHGWPHLHALGEAVGHPKKSGGRARMGPPAATRKR